LPAAVGEIGHPLVLDGQHMLVGTSTGVWRFTEGASTPWTQVFTGGVVGEPVRGGTSGPISWLTAGGSVIRSTDGGMTWDPVSGTGTPVANLTLLPDGRLLAVGSTTLVTLADGGTGWTAFGPALPFAPAGVAYSPDAKATFIWRGTCGADSAMRLADG
jgi:hypothetical protein